MLVRCIPAIALNAESGSLPSPPAARCAAPSSTRTAGDARRPLASGCHVGYRKLGEQVQRAGEG